MSVMPASGVLGTHLDLIERYRHPHPEVVKANLTFGLPDGLLLRMLGTARTYQVAEPMVVLGEHLSARQDDPVLGELDPAEFPWPNGFLWLDKPLEVDIDSFMVQQLGDDVLARVDDSDFVPTEILAISWLKTEAYATAAEGMSVAREQLPRNLAQAPSAVRKALKPAGGAPQWHTASWVVFWKEPPDEEHRQIYGPLFPCGWIVFPGYRARTNHADKAVISLLRALWALMDMELAATERPQPNRQERRRAARLNVVPDVRVVTLRRTRKLSETTGEHRNIDWSCQWLVRPHRRHFANGGSTWVRAYIKGPDNKPLRLNEVADSVLYKLTR